MGGDGSCEGLNQMVDASDIVTLVTSKPEAEFAAEMKARLNAAMAPVLALFDEASANGLTIQWDTLSPQPPRYRHAIIGLRLVKTY